MDKILLKKRKIKINKISNQENIITVQKKLQSLGGVISVNVDRKKSFLSLEYDLRSVKFETIEKTLNDLGVRLSCKLTERLKRGMAKFTEQNELDNMKAPLSSCCEDPKSDSQGCRRCVQ